jgi:putative ABC transport system substrate-binding protein
MMVGVSRRTFVRATAGWLALTAVGLQAQPRRSGARVAVLLATNRSATTHLMKAFTGRMAELGWSEGKNIEYVVRYAENDAARFGPLAAELLAGKPDVLFAPFGPVALAAIKHDRRTPVVFALTIDPVGLGLVASLARPGGNATGLTTRGEQIIGKRLELLREVVPSMRRVGVLIDRELSTARTEMEVAELQRAASDLGMQVVLERYGIKDELRPAVDRLKRNGADAIFGMAEQYGRRRELVTQVTHAGLAGCYNSTDYVNAGGLMALGPKYEDRYRRAADYVDKILRGAKPSDLPVEEASTLELVVNAKAAKALGIKIPNSVLLRADRVIE